MEVPRQRDHEEVELGEDANKAIHLLYTEVLEFNLEIKASLVVRDVKVINASCLSLQVQIEELHSQEEGVVGVLVVGEVVDFVEDSANCRRKRPAVTIMVDVRGQELVA